MLSTLLSALQRACRASARWVAAAICAMTVGASPAPAAADSAADSMVGRLVLVEFFTAQGCDPCRPTSHSLAQLASARDILLLTFSVDHWDYLGWRDTHAKPEFTLRQRAYAAAMGIRGLTTPQVVVNGARAESGAASSRVRDVIARTPGARPITLRVIPGVNDIISITIGRGPLRSPQADVWLVSYNPTPTAITPERGEAAGVSVVQHNVVTDLEKIGAWAGRPKRFDARCASACAIIVQEPNGGAVLAIADHRADNARMAQRP